MVRVYRLGLLEGYIKGRLAIIISFQLKSPHKTLQHRYLAETRKKSRITQLKIASTSRSYLNALPCPERCFKLWTEIKGSNF